MATRRKRAAGQPKPGLGITKPPTPADVRELAQSLSHLRTETVVVAVMLELGGIQGEHVELVAEALGLTFPSARGRDAAGRPTTNRTKLRARLRLAHRAADTIGTALLVDGQEAWSDLTALDSAHRGVQRRRIEVSDVVEGCWRVWHVPQPARFTGIPVRELAENGVRCVAGGLGVDPSVAVELLRQTRPPGTSGRGARGAAWLLGELEEMAGVDSNDAKHRTRTAKNAGRKRVRS